VARTRLNPRLAKLNRTYALDEVGRLYSVHSNTVRRWITEGGLEAIDDRRPTLVQGAVLRAFLTARRAAAKRPTPPGMLHCFGCRDSRAPALGMADFVPSSGGGAGNLRALCGTCGTVMNRRARQEALPLILPNVEVRVVEAALRIAERPSPCLNSALKKDERT
jgi:hypothetical protein